MWTATLLDQIHHPAGIVVPLSIVKKKLLARLALIREDLVLYERAGYKESSFDLIASRMKRIQIIVHWQEQQSVTEMASSNC